MAFPCAGVTLSSFCGSIGSVMVPEDGDFVITQALQPRSVLARPSKELGTTQLHVDDFEVKANSFSCKHHIIFIKCLHS